MKLNQLFGAFTVLALALPVSTFSQSDEVKKTGVSLESLLADFDGVEADVAVPAEFSGKNMESVYTILKNAETLANLRANDESAAHYLDLNPCIEYELIHDVAYEVGSVYTNYPKPSLVKGSKAAVKSYHAAFTKAEELVKDAVAIGLVNACAAPNGKCCNNSGALDKCDPAAGKYCEITGSVDNCQTGSNNC